jgi:hypothetical protein
MIKVFWDISAVSVGKLVAVVSKDPSAFTFKFKTV